MKNLNRIALSFLAFLVAGVVDAGPKVVFLIGEREYDTNITLPAFAKSELEPRGYDCVFVFAAGDEGPERDLFPGIEAIDDADLLVVSTRRRALKKEDLDRVRKHLEHGKPLVAIRTACHGFALRNAEPPEGHDVWPAFDQEILGIRYDNHLANDAKSTYLPVNTDEAVMKGVGTDPIPSDGSLYRMYDLAEDATLLLNGTTTIDGEQFTFPAAWLRTTDKGSRIFGSSIGHKSDFAKPAIRQLLVNSFAWCLEDMKLAAAPSGAALAAVYGFAPVEVFELDWRTFGLQPGDFNNDGLTDLAAVDNRKSRIALFLQRGEPKDQATSNRPNAVVDPGRFDQQSVLADRALTALAVADVNGDGLADLVTLEKPERLVVRVQGPSGFSELQSIRIPDAGVGQYDLAAADLDGDGDAEVVVLGARETTLFESKGSTGLVARKPYLNTSDDLDMLQLVDVDGDGRVDWFYAAKDASGTYICYRQQVEEALTFGPEIRLSKDEYRALALCDVDSTAGTDLVAIDRQTGRLEVLHYGLDDEESAGPLSEQVLQHGLTGGRQDRGAVVGDFNGDKRADLVVSSPKSAECILFIQGEDGLEAATLCPTLMGITSLQARDFNGDGRDELVVLSEDESSLGVASWDAEKSLLGFPEIITLADGAKPIDVVVPDAVANDQQGFVVVQQEKDKKIKLSTWTSVDGAWQQQRATDMPIADPIANGLLQLDANADGRTDFLCLSRREGPKLLLTNDAGELTSTSGGLSLPRLNRVNVTVPEDGQSLLVTQDRYVRRMAVDESGSWQVREQFNAPNSGVSFESAIDLAGAGEQSKVCAYDNKEGRLYVFSGDELPQTIDVGQFQLQQLVRADLDGDSRPDVALIAADRLGIVRSSGRGPTLKPLLTFESDDERAYFADVVVGDVNSDGRADLVVNETREHTIAIVTPLLNQQKAEQAMRFKLFEEKSFSSDREQPGLQPRQILIADVTGDGRDDMIMLCHDRLLVHPQDAPESAEVAAGVK